jgi:hypothetical protein
VAFTTLGFMGLYLVMGVLFLYLILREIGRGPLPAPGRTDREATEPEAVEKPAPVVV